MLHLLCDGKTTPVAERFGGYAKPHRRLLSFVFVTVNHSSNPCHQLLGYPLPTRNLLWAAVLLNVSMYDAIQHIIRGQIVCVELPWSKFCRWGFGDSVKRYGFSASRVL